MTACVLSVTHVYVTNAIQDVDLGRHSTRDDTDDFQLAITDQKVHKRPRNIRQGLTVRIRRSTSGRGASFCSESQRSQSFRSRVSRTNEKQCFLGLSIFRSQQPFCSRFLSGLEGLLDFLFDFL